MVQFTNCSALAETSCWHAKVRTACPRSCGQCPGQQPAPSTTCYNQSVMRNKKLDMYYCYTARYNNCGQLAGAELGLCSNPRVRQGCRAACGEC